MNPFQVENTELFERSAVGKTRLFVKPGSHDGFTAEHPFVYQGLAEVTIPTLTRSEPTEAELPSDVDGSTTVSITTGLGSYEKITGTITQPMNDTMSEGYWEVFRTNVPFAMWLPNGATRQMEDPHDHRSAWLVDRAYINSIGPDNNANPRDRTTVNEWFNLSIEYAASSADIHIMSPITIEKQGITGGGESIVALAVRDRQEGADIVAVTDAVVARAADSSTDPATTAIEAAAPSVFTRNNLGVWSSAVEVDFGSDQKIDDAAILGSYAVFISSAAGAHGYIPVDDLLSGMGTLTQVTGGYNSGDGPKSLYAPSPGLLVMVGIDGYIYKTVSIFSAPTIVDAGVASSNDLNSVHGLRSQIMAGGAANTIVVSSDFGETWKAATGPSGTSSDVVNSIVMLERNIALAATEQGNLYRTEDFGGSWSEVNLPFTVSAINAISFRKNEASQSLVGYMVGSESSTKGFVARSIDAGATWISSTQHIASSPTNIDLEAVSAFQTAPNGVVIGGAETARTNPKAGTSLLAVA